VTLVIQQKLSPGCAVKYPMPNNIVSSKQGDFNVNAAQAEPVCKGYLKQLKTSSTST
jgi:hypothetical protein